MAQSNLQKKNPKKKLNSQGAYSVLKDDSRLIENSIQENMDNALFPRNTGLFLTEDNESMPVFYPVGSVEKVFSRKSDPESGLSCGARIVLTKDNYGHRATGLGGLGATYCEAIDIVAGSLSCEDRVLTSDIQSRANFISDGARIYLTERGDIQHYFGLGNASTAVSITSQLKSGIGIKADHTLIIGRERVRILAGFSNAVGGERLVNQNKNITPRIELAATYDDGAQPAVLGDNLVKYLKEQNAEIQKLRNKIYEVEINLVRYKTAMAMHVHTGFGLGVVQTTPAGSAVSEAAKSIPEFLETTTSSIIETYNTKIKEWQAFGVEGGVIKGSPDTKLLSDTVFIGR